MVVILHECVCGDQRVLTIQTSGTGDAAAPANRKAHDKKSSRTCKIYIKQDKVNKADSAFIFLIILLISRNGQSGKVGQFGWGGQGGLGGELCKILNDKIVWCSGVWSGMQR